jgi:phosphoribosyl-ATP pyrophosphohydrolase
VKPEDVWREMKRREEMLGIAEKLPKSAVRMPKAPASAALPAKALSKTLPKELSKAAASPGVRRRIVALEGRSLRKRH